MNYGKPVFFGYVQIFTCKMCGDKTGEDMRCIERRGQ